jgi:tRNA(fMet)-specific endonuclease VapC
VNGRVLFDTNIIIALFSKDPVITSRITNALEVFIPCIAIGELYFGAYKSNRVKENQSFIDEFCLNNTILQCNADTAKMYGEIKNYLKEKGQPIPENDIWIAAIARQYSLTLVTRDKHFTNLANLQVEIW